MGILNSALEDLKQKSKELHKIQETLDLFPLNNENLWSKEWNLILEVNESYKKYLKLLDKHRQILGDSKYQELLIEAHNIAHTGREFLN